MTTENMLLHTDLQGGDKLRKSDEQKVEVEEELELFVEDEGEEVERIILLVSHNVWRELFL
jgi:hypothetical protein